MNRGALSALILVLGVTLGLLLARYYPVGGETQELESILKRQNELLEQQARLISKLQERGGGGESAGEPAWLESFSGRSPSRGPETAEVAIVVFSDFNCRHCAGMAGVLERVWSTYGERVRVIFKHNPLAAHPLVLETHRASVAAFQQGRFWEMQALLFANQEDLDSSSLRRHAKAIGLNIEQFEDDLASAEVKLVVERDIAQAKKASVSRMPTLFLEGERLQGGVTYDQLVAEIEKKLGSAAAGSDPLR
ncbi:MAG: thioredoxin domain-containing protein [Planctomycetota bacterium]|nr:thioredoxin domain-containing protein [Planctomycetota bacterium]